MASTRAATGNSRPRVFAPVSTEPASRKKAAGTKRKTTAKKPATKKTTTGRVSKKTGTTKHKPTVGDKVKGAVEKAKGTVERKPGKKGELEVSFCRALLPCGRIDLQGGAREKVDIMGKLGRIDYRLSSPVRSNLPILSKGLQ